MQLRHLVSLLCPLLGLYSYSALATVLFLNLNNSSGEVEAARRAALARGEEFVVVPSQTFTRDEQAKLAALSQRLTVAREKMAAITTQSPAQSRELAAEIKNIRGQQESITAERTFSLGQLDSTIKSKDPKSFSTLIVSGHSSGIDYGGLLGSIKLTDLKSRGLNNLKSVYLLGCYSMTPAAASWWKQQFPDVKFVAGYARKGFLDSDKRAANTLSELMSVEAPLRDAKSNANAASILNSVQKKMGTSDKELAFKVDSNYVLPKEGKNIPIDGMGALICRDYKQFLMSTSKTISDYEQGLKPIPTDEPGSPLREYYNEAQRYSICENQVDHSTRMNQVISLIKFPHVLENFKLYYASDIARVNEILSRLRAQGICKETAGFPGADLKILNRQSNAFYNCLEELRSSKVETSAAEKALIEKMTQRTQRLLIMRDCVPAIRGNWIEKPQPALTLGKPEELPDCEDLAVGKRPREFEQKSGAVR